MKMKREWAAVKPRRNEYEGDLHASVKFLDCDPIDLVGFERWKDAKGEEQAVRDGGLAAGPVSSLLPQDGKGFYQGVDIHKPYKKMEQQPPPPPQQLHSTPISTHSRVLPPSQPSSTQKAAAENAAAAEKAAADAKTKNSEGKKEMVV